MSKNIAIGCDHAGLNLKKTILDFLISSGYKVNDFGTNNTDSVDYPDYAQAVAKSIIDKTSSIGILICGTGIGISIAANRFKEIRAANCHNVETAKLSRQHNNANVLALGARIIDEKTALDCVKTFLKTEFEGGRHQKRIDKFSNNANS